MKNSTTCVKRGLEIEEQDFLRRKMCQENLSQQERRRSARIIAQEEKKENERKTLQESAKNKSQNLEPTKKDKGKKVIDADDDFTDDFDYASTKKRGRKCRALNQLLSSTLEGLYRKTGSWSTGIYDLNDMPQNYVLEFVIDVLQRIDRNEFFAQPVNPDEVVGYYDIIKQPMDFGTMRAKLQEKLYTNLEELEHDVQLMCNNAMTFNARNTVYYKVASTIMDRAQSIFAGLRANPEHIDLETLGVKKRGRRGPQSRSYRSVRLPTRHYVGSYGADHEVEERRNTYSPPKDNSLASQVLQGPKQSFLLNFEALPNYEESLKNFGKGLGPVAQRIIKRKLETLRLYKFLSGDTASQNQNQASNSSHQGIPRLSTPQATPAQHQASCNDLVLSHTRQLTPQAKSADHQLQASYSNLMLPRTQQLAPQATKTQQETSPHIDLMFSPTQKLTPQAKPTYNQHQASYSDLLLPRTQLLNPQATATQHQATSYVDLLLSPTQQQLTPQAKPADQKHQASYMDLMLSPAQQLTPQAKPADQKHEASYSDLLLAPSHQLTPPQATSTQQNEASYNDITLSHTQRLTPQARPTLRREHSYRDLLLSHALPLSNKPLSIPGVAATAKDRNMNTNNQQGTSVRDKGKAICIDEGSYDAAAAALLGSIFQNYDKGKGSSAFQGEASSSSSIRRPLQYDLNNDVDICDPHMNQMVPSLGNEAPVQAYGQDSIHQQSRDLLQLSAYKNNASSGQCSNSLGMSDTLQSNYLGRPGRVRSRVWPTRVISGPQPNQSQSRYGQSQLSEPILPNNYKANCSAGNNYSVPSQVSHRSSSTELISATNSRRQAILPTQTADQTSWLSSLYQPENFQQLLGSSDNRSPSTEAISATNSRRQAILHTQAADQTSWLSSLYQPKNSQALLGSSINRNPLSELNTYGYAGTNHTTPTYGFGGMNPTSFTGYGGSANLQGRAQEGPITQLLWNEKDHPELALQL